MDKRQGHCTQWKYAQRTSLMPFSVGDPLAGPTVMHREQR